MEFEVILSPTAQRHYDELRQDKSRLKRYKAVKKTIEHLSNPRHPGLQTHPYSSLPAIHGKKIYEAYAQQDTPGAYRVFWRYGPAKNQIEIIAITPHP
jgi:hypothetical protein